MSLLTFLGQPVVNRAYKTFVQVSAAQVALLGTGKIDYPLVEGAAMTLGATALSVLWNGTEAAVAKRKASNLAKLAAAIDQAVTLAEVARAEQNKQPGNTPAA